MNSNRKLPYWLKRPLPCSDKYKKVDDILQSLNIKTICSNANCPNRGECWDRGTATVLILGDICTRNCKFCSVAKGKPASPPDTDEPRKLTQLTKKLNLKYLVITSVDRDDLRDGGAEHFKNCIQAVRNSCPQTKFEILTPDFKDVQQKAIDILKPALPFVFAHNIETVPALYKVARMGGNYHRSLKLLELAKKSFPDTPTKSSIMLGLGETDEQVIQTLKDLINVGCQRITIGQYLKPSRSSLEVKNYVPPEKFEWWRQKTVSLGFDWVMASPFTRSSYFAEKVST